MNINNNYCNQELIKTLIYFFKDEKVECHTHQLRDDKPVRILTSYKIKI